MVRSFQSDITDLKVSCAKTNERVLSLTKDVTIINKKIDNLILAVEKKTEIQNRFLKKMLIWAFGLLLSGGAVYGGVQAVGSRAASAVASYSSVK